MTSGRTKKAPVYSGRPPSRTTSGTSALFANAVLLPRLDHIENPCLRKVPKTSTKRTQLSVLPRIVKILSLCGVVAPRKTRLMARR